MKPIPAADISEGVRVLSDSLSDALARDVMKAVGEDTRAVTRALRDGDFDNAKRITRALGFTEALSKTTGRVRRFTRQAALIGSGAVDSPKTSIFASGAPWPWEIDEGAVRLLQAGSARMLDETKRKLEDRITRASRFQKSDRLLKAAALDPDDLAKQINHYLRGEIRRVVDVSANVVGTRTAAFGMYHEARVRGVAQYRIDAIIDTRTTEICKAMNGRVFEVEAAYTRTQQALLTTDPSQQKKVAPFPPSSDPEIETLKNLSAADLQARGFDTPPFHFLCRSVVTLVDSKTEYDPVDWSNFPEQQDAGAHERAMVPKYERIAREVWKEDDLDALFERAVAVDALAAGKGDNPLADVVSYTGNLYRVINQHLRRNRPFEAELDQTYLANVVRTLDDLTNKAEAPDVTYVYRGIKSYEAERLEIGKVFQDDGFMSTTLSPKVTADFTGAGGAVIQIEVGTGQKILPVFPTSLTPFEREMLLPRGSQLRIIGKAEQVIDGEKVTVYRAVLQGQGDTLAPGDIGMMELPEAESIIKATTDLEEKFVYERGDLREARMV